MLHTARTRDVVLAVVFSQAASSLEREGIEKFHVDVIRGNDLASRDWHSLGWHRRDDIDRYAFTRSNNPKA